MQNICHFINNAVYCLCYFFLGTGSKLSMSYYYYWYTKGSTIRYVDKSIEFIQLLADLISLQVIYITTLIGAKSKKHQTFLNSPTYFFMQ